MIKEEIDLLNEHLNVLFNDSKILCADVACLFKSFQEERKKLILLQLEKLKESISFIECKVNSIEEIKPLSNS